MTESSARTYQTLGRMFVMLGGGVALASVLDRAFAWGFFRGSPVGTALFLVVIGALLLRTVQAGKKAGFTTPSDAADEDTPTVDNAGSNAPDTVASQDR